MDADEKTNDTALPRRRSVRPDPANRVEPPSAEEIEKARQVLEQLTGESPEARTPLGPSDADG